MLTAFERAEVAEDPAERERLLTFVVVGGGPTGVEMAGAIAELARHALARDFRAIDPTHARVVLFLCTEIMRVCRVDRQRVDGDRSDPAWCGQPRW